MASRRGFLQAAAAALHPSSRQAVTEIGRAALFDQSLRGQLKAPQTVSDNPYPPSCAPDKPLMDPKAAIEIILSNKEWMNEVESACFEENRFVHVIDHDLWSKRSFSMAAKITFQRQRNVRRSMEGMRYFNVIGPSKSPHSMMSRLFQKLVWGSE